MKKAYTFWMIGLPSSGKTTLASEVCKKIKLVHLDSDEIRSSIVTNPDFSRKESEILYGCMMHMSRIFNDLGHNVIVSATSHLEKYRDKVKKSITNFKYIYIKCPVEVCEQRDVKGLYKESREGRVATFPIKVIGENEDYINMYYKSVEIFESPEKFDLSINTSELTLNESVNILKSFIEKVKA